MANRANANSTTNALDEMRVCFQGLSLSARRARKSKLGVFNRFASSSDRDATPAKWILKDVSGCFRPGEMTLLLGQPGAGKSVLMKLLSGRMPMASNLMLDGAISYNGIPCEHLEKRLPQFVSYVTQQDTHIPILTVKETFKFAYEFSGGGSGSNNGSKSAVTHDSHPGRDPDSIVDELGLQSCQDTVIGDAMLRGVSGGERKRVTTGEMQFGVQAVSLMDEISTGLDSAATFDIVKAQQHLAHRWRKTIVVSLLQPSPEVFALFDNVLLMNSGETLFNGPREQVLPYFESLGFKCPPRRDIADFLCDLASDAQFQYQTSSSHTDKLTGHHPRSASEFARLWKESSLGRALAGEVARFVESEAIEKELEALAHVPEFFQGWWSSTWTLAKREGTVLARNVPLVVGRAMLALFTSLIFASLFAGMDLSDSQLLMGMIFSGATCIALGEVSMIAPFFDTREVFYKQRRANFYRTSSFVIATMLGQIPLVALETVIYAVLMYWPGGLVPSASSFLIFFLLLFLQALVEVAIVFFLASVCPSLHLGEPISMMVLFLMTICSGFMAFKDDIPDYLIWIYWITPFAWGIQGMALTQYGDPELDRCMYGDYDYCANTGLTLGKYSLGLFDMETDRAWIGYAVIFLVAEVLVLNALSSFALEHIRFERRDYHSEDNEEESAQEHIEYQALATPQASNLHVEKFGEKAITIPHDVRERIVVPPVALGFQDLWYSVPAPKNRLHEAGPDKELSLLRGITGYALPGTMTALMGSTGAGKTTLMDVIAARKTSGTIKGSILLNGRPATDLAVRRCAAYCEQMDMHSEATTFREAIAFSAFLRQGQKFTKDQILDSIDECLDILELNDIAENIVGEASMEQRKRLTIGVELAAQPSVLFLDEPTSGLDARSAKIIMNGVRKVADSGRTIVCTIHQPSSEVFFLFDNLLLLQRGGTMVYFGELGHQGRAIIDYFESMPGVPKIADGYNPATWMLEVIGAGVSRSTDRDPVDFPSLFKLSAANERLTSMFSHAGVFVPSEDVEEITFSNKRAATESTQFAMLLRRFFLAYWRTPSYTLTRLVMVFVVPLLCGLMYLSADYTTYGGVNGGLSAIYMTNSFLGFLAYMSIFPLAFGDRAPFYRERASQTFNSLWYFVSFSLVEIPYSALSALVATAVFYPMLGFAPALSFGDYVIYWLVMVLHMLFQVYLGQFLVFALPSIEVASVSGVCLDTLQFMLMGFNPPAGSIPHAYKWLYAIVPQRLMYDSHASIAFGQCSNAQLLAIESAIALNQNTAQLTADWPLGCQVLTDAPLSVGNVTVQEYIGLVFDVHYDDLGLYLGTQVAMIVVFRLLTAFAMRYINHQKR